MDFHHFPRPDCVRGRIFGSLLRGERLTQQDSLHRFSDFRLAAHVEAQRKAGWEINTEMIDVGTNDAGRRAEVARYSMSADAIAEAGEKGRQFAEAARLAEIERKAT